MANNRPIHTKRWPSRRGTKRKIPWNRVAHKRDTLPGFITNGCSPTIPQEEGLFTHGCPANLQVPFQTGACRGRMIIEVVPTLLLQARQDHLTVVGVDGEFWWSAVPSDPAGCLSDDVTAWAVWSLIRYESDVVVGTSTEQRAYNPWDSGLDTSTSTAPIQAGDAFGFVEGDFSAPRDRISWQKHQLWEATSLCLVDEGRQNISLSGDLPCSNVGGTLVNGSGSISTTCDATATTLSGFITASGDGSQTVSQPKTSHMRIHSRAKVPLKGNQTMVLQVDFGDPFTDCTSGVEPQWEFQCFGYLRPKVELA